MESEGGEEAHPRGAVGPDTMVGAGTREGKGGGPRRGSVPTAGGPTESTQTAGIKPTSQGVNCLTETQEGWTADTANGGVVQHTGGTNG